VEALDGLSDAAANQRPIGGDNKVHQIPVLDLGDRLASPEQDGLEADQYLKSIEHLPAYMPPTPKTYQVIVQEGAGFWTLMVVFLVALLIGICCGTIFPIDTLLSTVMRLNLYGWAIVLIFSSVAILFLYLLSHSL
jgi:hypothetical protein